MPLLRSRPLRDCYLGRLLHLARTGQSLQRQLQSFEFRQYLLVNAPEPCDVGDDVTSHHIQVLQPGLSQHQHLKAGQQGRRDIAQPVRRRQPKHTGEITLRLPEDIVMPRSRLRLNQAQQVRLNPTPVPLTVVCLSSSSRMTRADADW